MSILPGGERVEHECVVGVRAVGDVNRGHGRLASRAIVMSFSWVMYSGSCFARSVGTAATNLSR